jgi:hypothetical protein
MMSLSKNSPSDPWKWKKPRDVWKLPCSSMCGLGQLQAVFGVFEMK